MIAISIQIVCPKWCEKCAFMLSCSYISSVEFHAKNSCDNNRDFAQIYFHSYLLVQRNVVFPMPTTLLFLRIAWIGYLLLALQISNRLSFYV